jgi:Zn-dependent peptidase ImmA (M78 family)
MQRGFKTRAEKTACEFRKRLNLSAYAPLRAKILLGHLKIAALEPRDIPGLRDEVIRETLNGSSQHWSAITIYDATGSPFIIYNSAHGPSRQESDLMHEAAHIVCEHPPGKIMRLGKMTFRSYNKEHEEEAEWLGGCLQITRQGLLWALQRRMTTEQIAEHFGASEALARYRRNVTGVDAQLMRRYRFAARYS